tara:strand:+ start:2718 stop:3758 length:1041 start_codon:yes stop_codon:yes gene_type:complete
MKIAVYSDKFSGTLTASEVIETIKELFEINSIKASYFPVTDGGEDSTIIFKEYGTTVKESLKVKDLVGTEKVIQLLDISGDVFFESSLLVGINNTDVDTMDLNTGCLSEIIKLPDVIGLGGSRTNDGGFGLLSKMGVNFFVGNKLISDPKPSNFEQITNIEIEDSFERINKKVLVDTFIPLLGNQSAIEVFGPQKGLNQKNIEKITYHLDRIINLISSNFQTQLDPAKKGTGAAGGLGFALSEVLGCELVSGAEYFFEKSGLEQKINSFDLSILCEGKFDNSSLEGKVLGQILKKNKGKSYFLGGIYDYEDRRIFENMFECGDAGLKNPKKELISATKKLVNQITI